LERDDIPPHFAGAFSLAFFLRHDMIILATSGTERPNRAGSRDKNLLETWGKH
jgi:hypothetical protein